MSLSGPFEINSSISIGDIRDSLASTIAFSGVPPRPIPRIPGGHQPAPMPGIVSTTQSDRLSLGFKVLNRALFSDPPPLAASVISIVSPATSSVCTTAGVLSPVLCLLPNGGDTTEGRRGLSGLV